MKDGPIFVLTAARSGSTLLRLILDGHPEIACPPETNLVAAFGAIAFTCQNALSGDGDEHSKNASIALARKVAEETVGVYADRSGKRRWCEKSLPTVDGADYLVEVFPDAQFICLYRECTDTIVSLMDACSWGFAGYGVEPFVHQNPTNLPWALAAYWAERCEAISIFEQAHPKKCLRVRYEDLVFDPERTVALLCDFLEVDWDEGLCRPEHIFRNPSRFGIGDHKVRYTQTINQDSVGRGWTVPIELIPETLRERINSLADRLGYPRLETEVREGLSRLRGGAPHSSDATADALSDVMRRLADRLARREEDSLSSGGAAMAPRIKLILTEDAEPYLIDFGTGDLSRDEAEAPCTIVTDSQTLIGIATGRCNPATAVRQSKLRIAGDEGQSLPDLLCQLDALVDALRADLELVVAA